MEINYLDVELMEKMCHRLAVAIFDKKEEPISPFSDHDNNLLESALNSPKASFGSIEKYPTIEEKAAVIYYHLNKNHPFKNGNKRMATASLLTFLFINDYWLIVKDDELVNKTLYVANSNPKDREEILEEVIEWIKSNIIKLKELRNQIAHNN